MHKVLKHLVHPVTGKELHFGRHRPARPPRFHMYRYIDLPTLPVPPAVVDYSPKAEGVLDQMWGNDSKGDCTCVAAFRSDGLMIANSGAVVPPSFNTANCLALYFGLTGGQDTGLDELTVLNHWKAKGLFDDGSHKIAGYVGVNGASLAQIQFGAWGFGSLYISLSMPDGWLKPMPEPGFVWDVAGPANNDNGHAFGAFGYGTKGIFIDPWGGVPGTMTYAAAAKYCDGINGQIYVPLSEDAIVAATAKTPSGFDFDQLNTDLETDFSLTNINNDRAD